MIEPAQLQKEIILPALYRLSDWTNKHMCDTHAIMLLMGTCAQESQMGRYLKQINGPACGIYQMEPKTYLDVWNRSMIRFPELKIHLSSVYGGGQFTYHRLVEDLSYATIFCRLFYYLIPKSLPSAYDVNAIGNFWKTYYNTKHGKGTVEEFVKNFYHFKLDRTLQNMTESQKV